MNLIGYSKEDMEADLDKAKVEVVETLVKEGLLSDLEGEKWCNTHTIIMRKKSFFRTISRAWRMAKPLSNNYYLIVVKKVLGA